MYCSQTADSTIKMTQRFTSLPTLKAVNEHSYPLYKGLFDGLNVIDTFRLIRRSSRIKKFIYNALPVYLVFICVNFGYGFWYYPNILPYRTWYTRIITKLMWWGLWFIPSYIVCKVLYYKQFMELWKTVYSKRKNSRNSSTKQDKKKRELDTWTSISELIYGVVLSSAYFIQTKIFDYIIPITSVRLLFSTVAFSWMISWGVFEYRFIYEGKDLYQRIRYFERRWLYFLGFGIPISMLYTFVFDWYIGMNVWYPIVMFLSFRAILSTPIKSPKYTNDAKDDISTTNESSPLLKRPNAKPRPSTDQRRLRIFFIAEYISTVCVSWAITQRNRYIKID